LFKAWLAQMRVEVDKAGKRYEPTGIHRDSALFTRHILGVHEESIANSHIGPASTGKLSP
jgi:hypothetical protein